MLHRLLNLLIPDDFMNYGSTACTCSKSRFQFLQQHSQQLCLHVLDGTMQQQQTPIPPAVLISMISAACSNSHIGCNLFSSHLCFTCTLKDPSVMPGHWMSQNVHQILLSTFFYHTSPFAVKSCSVRNIIWLHNRYTIQDYRYKVVVPCTINPYQLWSMN